MAAGSTRGRPSTVSRASAPALRASSASRCVSVGCGASGASLVVAQHADDRAHLLERAPALGLDLGQQRALVLGLAFGQRGQLGQAALQQRVELGRQAGALARDLEPRVLVAGAAQLTCARVELLDHARAAAHDQAEAPGRERER